MRVRIRPSSVSLVIGIIFLLYSIYINAWFLIPAVCFLGFAGLIYLAKYFDKKGKLRGD